MLYRDGHVEAIAPYYGGGPLGWRLLWNCEPP